MADFPSLSLNKFLANAKTSLEATKLEWAKKAVEFGAAAEAAKEELSARFERVSVRKNSKPEPSEAAAAAAAAPRLPAEPPSQSSPTGGRWRAEESARWQAEAKHWHAADSKPLRAAVDDVEDSVPKVQPKAPRVSAATSRLRRTLQQQQAVQRGEDPEQYEEVIPMEAPAFEEEHGAADARGRDAPSIDQNPAAATAAALPPTGYGRAPLSSSASACAAAPASHRPAPPPASSSSSSAAAPPRRRRLDDDWSVAYVEHADALAVDLAVEPEMRSSGGGDAPTAAAEAEARAAALAAELAAVQRKLKSAQAEAAAASKREAEARQQAAAAKAPVGRPSAKEADDASLCVVCLESERTHALIPCGHRCLCAKCAERYEAHMRMDDTWQGGDEGAKGGGGKGGGGTGAASELKKPSSSKAAKGSSSSSSWCNGNDTPNSDPGGEQPPHWAQKPPAHTCPLCRKAVSSVLLVWE